MNIRFSLFLVFLLGFWTSVQARFVDIDVTHPNFYAIDFLESQGVVQGFEKDDSRFFGAIRPIFRSEVLKILTLSSKTPLRQDHALSFPDVPSDAWYKNYLTTAHSLGYIEGFPDGNFYPSRNVSWAEFVKMLVFFFDIPVEEEKSGEEWYDRFFMAAEEFNILPDEMVDPAEVIVRGDAAELTYRALKVKEGWFKEPYRFRGAGEASYYHDSLSGNGTANGELYDPEDLTAAHRTLPFGTYLRVYHGDKSVIVRVNDRGPYHEERVLDLSKKAFELLSPLSRGVIGVEFEMVSGPLRETPSIPEQVRPKLSAQGRSLPIPEIVAEHMEEGVSLVTKPLFDESISHLPVDFFPHADLRRSLPQKIKQGTVFLLAGTALDHGYRDAIFFLEKVQDETAPFEQIHFSGKISGKNFSFPVMFLDPGTYKAGLIFDDQRRSRVGEIQVVSNTKKRFFPDLEAMVEVELDVRVIPEDEEVSFDWTSSLKESHVTKITFSQGQNQKVLYIEDNLDTITLPYNFFDGFEYDKTLALDIYQALSEDGTLQNQMSGWEKGGFENFILVPGFPDFESRDIAVFDFPRFLRDLNEVRLEGKILDNTIVLEDTVFLQKPDGLVDEFSLIQHGGGHFSFSFEPADFGTYVVQLLDKEKDTLFKRALYFSKNQVLPVGTWVQTLARHESVSGVRYWINVLRERHGLSPVFSDKDLDIVAQRYAEEMARNNFISHTSVTGQTFRSRLEEMNLVGEFGENLSFGSDFKQALLGLENSLAHRKNILTRKWKHVGIGMQKNNKGEVYIVQVFGK